VKRGDTVEPSAVIPHFWLGATVRSLAGEEYSAFGVSKESGGIHLQNVPSDCLAAGSGFKTDDLIQSVNGAAVKHVRDLLRSVNEAAGKPLKIGVVRGQQITTIEVTVYSYCVTELSPTADGFQRLPLGGNNARAAIQRITTRPATRNDPPATLHDGKLAANYGPVFGNGTVGGIYKADLGRELRVTFVNTWSHNESGNRGPQHFVLFGSASQEDPGWDVTNRARFTPLAEVDAASGPRQEFHATSVRSSDGKPLGNFRWLLWMAIPVSPIQENTSFQEFQVGITP
jgi:hypothetical protein